MDSFIVVIVVVVVNRNKMARGSVKGIIPGAGHVAT